MKNEFNIQKILNEYEWSQIKLVELNDFDSCSKEMGPRECLNIIDKIYRYFYETSHRDFQRKQMALITKENLNENSSDEIIKPSIFNNDGTHYRIFLDSFAKLEQTIKVCEKLDVKVILFDVYSE